MADASIIEITAFKSKTAWLTFREILSDEYRSRTAQYLTTTSCRGITSVLHEKRRWVSSLHRLCMLLFSWWLANEAFPVSFGYSIHLRLARNLADHIQVDCELSDQQASEQTSRKWCELTHILGAEEARIPEADRFSSLAERLMLHNKSLGFVTPWHVDFKT